MTASSSLFSNLTDNKRQYEDKSYLMFTNVRQIFIIGIDSSAYKEEATYASQYYI